MTSVVLFVNNALMGPLLKAATAQEFSPEWVFTGYSYQDFDVFARGYDQEQMKHAFGLSVLFPSISNLPDYLDLWTWYWGKTQGNFWGIASGLFNSTYTAIQYAGPTLTAENVKKGFFSVPATGGAATGTVAFQSGYGKTVGMPYDEYSLLGTDRAFAYWNGDVTRPVAGGEHPRQGRVHVHGRRQALQLQGLPQVGAEVLRPQGRGVRGAGRCAVHRRLVPLRQRRAPDCPSNGGTG